jgi:hypothetical protein
MRHLAATQTPNLGRLPAGARRVWPSWGAYPGPVAGVDLVDETYVVVERARIAGVVADPTRWRQWWPSLDLAVFMDRGLDGVRWSMTGELVGSAEIWLENHGDGVIVHFYLRGEPTVPGSPATPRALPGSARGRREMDRLRRRHALAWKRIVWSLKDEMEGERRPGEPGWTRG